MAADKERGSGSASAEIGKYLDILAKDPNSRVFAPLAEAYRKSGLFDDAIEIALEGLKVHPNYLGGRVALGRAYFEKKQFAEAASEMQKVVKSAPDNIIAHKVLGQIAYAQSDLSAAEKAFKMVLLLDPRDQEAQQLVANIGGGAPATVLEDLPARAAPPLSPPPPPPPASAPVTIAPLRPPEIDVLPIEEIPPLNGLDLPSSEDLFGEPSGPGTPVELDATSALEVMLPPHETDGALDGGPGSLPDPEPALLPMPVPAPAPEPTDTGMVLETFPRVPWGQSAAVPAPASVMSTLAPSTAEEPPPAEEESPFEVFGRPKAGGPPQSTKGEQQAFGEIDLEPTSYAPDQAEPEPGSEPAVESPFEIFTREPGVRVAPGPPRAVRGEEAVMRELEIETTAFTPPEVLAFEAAEMPVVSLDEELPRIDLGQEMELGTQEGSSPTLDLDLEPEPDGVLSLHEEIQPVDLVEETKNDPLGEELEDLAAETATPSVRGVFDTETLAGIYVNQGFYGRAAEIYRRLISQRPGDVDLRRKLDGVLALEGGGGAPAAAEDAKAVPAPHPVAIAEEETAQPAPGMTDPDQRVEKLLALLEAFKGGRPK